MKENYRLYLNVVRSFKLKNEFMQVILAYIACAIKTKSVNFIHLSSDRQAQNKNKYFSFLGVSLLAV